MNLCYSAINLFVVISTLIAFLMGFRKGVMKLSLYYCFEKLKDMGILHYYKHDCFCLI